MRAGRMLTACMIICLCFVSSLMSAPPQTVQGHWFASLRDAYHVSQRTNRPLVLVFGSEDCFYCRKLEKYTLKHRSIKKRIEQSYIPVYIDFNANPNVAKILEVQSLPTTIILSPEADLLGRRDGFMTPLQLQSLFSKATKLRERQIRQASFRSTRN